MNTNSFRSLLQGKGHGIFVSTARCLSNVLNCFIQLSKNTKEENHSFFTTICTANVHLLSWNRKKFKNLFLHHIGIEVVIC